MEQNTEIKDFKYPQEPYTPLRVFPLLTSLGCSLGNFWLKANSYILTPYRKCNEARRKSFSVP